LSSDGFFCEQKTIRRQKTAQPQKLKLQNASFLAVKIKNEFFKEFF